MDFIFSWENVIYRPLETGIFHVFFLGHVTISFWDVTYNVVILISERFFMLGCRMHVIVFRGSVLWVSARHVFGDQFGSAHEIMNLLQTLTANIFRL